MREAGRQAVASEFILGVRLHETVLILGICRRTA
jgi:hypothetical protein